MLPEHCKMKQTKSAYPLVLEKKKRKAPGDGAFTKVEVLETEEAKLFWRPPVWRLRRCPGRPDRIRSGAGPECRFLRRCR